MLLFLLLNIYIKLITCDPLLEIPFIKKALQEYRKKCGMIYHHKLLQPAGTSNDSDKYDSINSF